MTHPDPVAIFLNPLNFTIMAKRKTVARKATTKVANSDAGAATQVTNSSQATSVQPYTPRFVYDDVVDRDKYDDFWEEAPEVEVLRAELEDSDSSLSSCLRLTQTARQKKEKEDKTNRYLMLAGLGLAVLQFMKSR